MEARQVRLCALPGAFGAFCLESGGYIFRVAPFLYLVSQISGIAIKSHISHPLPLYRTTKTASRLKYESIAESLVISDKSPTYLFFTPNSFTRITN